MAILPGYELNEVICRSLRTSTYRGRRLADSTPVLAKVLDDDDPAPRELSRLKQEYALTAAPDLPGVLRSLDAVGLGSGLALIQEGFEGVLLQQVIDGRPLDLGLFLRTAVNLARTLEGLHQRNIVHNGIHPGSILLIPATGETRLTHLGRASSLSVETPRPRHPGMLEGALPYLSPEQTGRMNRAVDYRTDMYSLGVTFYEMLTGTLPFTAADPLEWVHCHIARQPEPLHLRQRSVPEAVSAIVLKLLAKAAEDRYQSAGGLRADLTRCLEQWTESGAIAPFALSQHDVPDRFRPSQRIYGREAEAAELLQAFQSAASGRSALALVSGYSGIGKSSLVHEVHRPIVKRQGYFASGKFDALNRDKPYSALIQAFQELVRQLLTEGEEQVARWRKQLVEALGSIGQVIIEVIPEVELITGPQPPLPPLPPLEAQNRFHLALRNFVHVFTRPEHPLVLFLDDLQWADTASLALLAPMCTDADQRHLLIIGAYRNNEVSSGHPLMLTVREIQRAEGKVHTIELAPLPASAAHQLTAETLHCDVERARPLADLILARTHGNPFFFNVFFKTLAGKGLLAFDRARGGWTWDLPGIRALDITDNVADLMRDKVEELPRAAQELLKRAACMGNRFDLRTLSVIAEQPLLEVGGALLEPIQAGLLLPLDEGYRLVNLERAQLTEAVNAEYKFAHDQIQQAAYALIPEQDRAVLHRKIGRLLLQRASAEQRAQQFFTIVHQLNQGRAQVEDGAEREQLAELNLEAGRKAKASSAYQPALHYLQTGLALLGERGWETRYELTLALEVEATEAAYLATSFEQMARSAERVLRHARTLLDKVKVHEVQILALVAQNQLEQAVHTALRALSLLGIRFPQKPGKPHLVMGLLRTKAALAGTRLEDLADLPEMRDPARLAASRLLATVSSVAYLATPELFPLIVFKQVELSARHGNAPESAYAYALYAIALCGVLGDIESGYRFGELALRLQARFNAIAFKAKVWMAVYHFIKPWKEPLRETQAPMLRAYQAGLESGDLEFCSHLANVYTIARYDIGMDLGTLDEEMLAFDQTVSKLKQERAMRVFSLMRQVVHNLRGDLAAPWDLEGPFFDEARVLPLMLEASDINALGLHCLRKLTLLCMFRRHAQALEQANRMTPYLEGLVGTYYTANYHFYDSIAVLAELPRASGAQRRQLHKRVAANQKKLKAWASHGAANFHHKVQLVEAERARVGGDARAARELYEQAISAAHQSGMLGEEALARELTGEFHLALGEQELAYHHLGRAYHAYRRWGALSKLKDLEARYPHLPRGTAAQLQPAGSAPTETSLDLLTVTKASQTISGEIVLARLLKKMMEIVIENAGAQKGFLIMEKAGRLVIEAEAVVDQEQITVLQSLPVDDSTRLARSVINYVARTREPVVLENAAGANLFKTDPYILQEQPLSVMCMTLVARGAITGILYLENNHTTGAFTPDRRQVLQLLSTQVAISIENAQLYNELERKVEERTQQLTQKNIDLEAALGHLKDTQAQLIQQEKLASLGQLTAGIAHEIKNPLNFINNFAQLTVELLEEAEEATSTTPGPLPAELGELIQDARQNAAKIHEHGRRADGIVSSMLEHSRVSRGEKRPTNLNALLEEYVNLVYHGTCGATPGFACTILRDYDPALPPLMLVPQDLSRVLVNLLNNAFYAVRDRQGHVPQVVVRTRGQEKSVEIRIEDNGPGVPENLRRKIFEPFFTTKPPGQGTGLGLSLSYEIITQGYGGTLEAQGREGEGAAFVLNLPLGRNLAPPTP